MATHAINVYKGGKIIGTSFCKPRFQTVIQLQIMLKLIENYNRNLIGRDLPDAVLAHRFLEQENINCNRMEWHSKICSASYTYLTTNYPKFYYPLVEDKGVVFDRTLSFETIDIKTSNMGAEHIMDVNLDANTIELAGYFWYYTEEEYCKKMKIDIKKFNKDKLAVYDNKVNTFCFNELEDLSIFISRNSEGFYNNMRDIIILPVEKYGD